MNINIYKVFVILLSLGALPGCDDHPSDFSQVDSICKFVDENFHERICGPDIINNIKSDVVSRQPLTSNAILLLEVDAFADISNDIFQEGFQPREDLPPWKFTFPIDWLADPFQDRNWRFYLHGWTMVDRLIMAYEKYGDSDYLRQAVMIVLDWYEFHYSQNKVADFSWYDAAVGFRAIRLAYLWDNIHRLEDSLKFEETKTLIELGFFHVYKLLEKNFIKRRGNHALFQVHGLMGICQTLHFLKNCDQGRRFATEVMITLLNSQFSKEAVHLEHSPSYHFMAADLVSNFINSKFYSDIQDLPNKFSKVLENKIWMVHPNKSVVHVGDSSGIKDVIWPIGNERCKSIQVYESQCFLLKTFQSTGYVIARSDWQIPEESASMLFFQASFHSAAHKHADDLSFELYEVGRRLLIDSGMY
ncbi:MAG: heparinase II/III family protein, partial [Gammaproteobacteria bacterium]|nr:heparinase II/III family protein [Gammaproteobacteria bacterium]